MNRKLTNFVTDFITIIVIFFIVSKIQKTINKRLKDNIWFENRWKHSFLLSKTTYMIMNSFSIFTLFSIKTKEKIEPRATKLKVCYSNNQDQFFSVEKYCESSVLINSLPSLFRNCLWTNWNSGCFQWWCSGRRTLSGSW